jgi:hypothetical protein
LFGGAGNGICAVRDVADASRQSRAEHYREVADSLARLARQTAHFEVRQELLELAERFERIAQHAEKWEDIER